MAESFAVKARKLMGWGAYEDQYDDDLSSSEEQLADVTRLTPSQEFTADVVTPFSRPIKSVRENQHKDLSRIMTVHAHAYSDAVTIGEAFRDGIPVIVNLTELDEDEARRLLDFASGLTFSLGSIEKVTKRVFLLSPQSVEVSTGNVGVHHSDFFPRTD